MAPRQACEAGGLGVSLFERLLDAGVPARLLDTQYRMHPAIAAFPSRNFYGGRLKNGVSPEVRRASPERHSIHTMGNRIVGQR